MAAARTKCWSFHPIVTMATGPVRHHRFTYNCWVNSQDRTLSSRTQRLLFLISFFPYFFFFLEGRGPEEQQHLRKLFEGCCRKRCLPWPAFPIAPAAQCRGAKAFLHHHGSSPSTSSSSSSKEWHWVQTYDTLPAISSVSHGDSTVAHPKSQDGAKPFSMTSSLLPYCCHS